MTRPITLNIPPLMEDELLYSYIGRLADANGMSVNTFTSTYIRDPKNDGYPKSRIPGPSAAEYIMKLCKVLDVNPADFYRKTTIYPGYAPLIRANVQMHFVNSAFRGKKKYPRLITTPKSEIKCLKYCPICMKKERKRYGFSWLHRAHHMPGVKVCYKHNVFLMQYDYSHVKYSPMPDFSGKTIPADTKNFTPEIEFAVFAKEFLDREFDTSAVQLRNFLVKDEPSYMSYIPRDFERLTRALFNFVLMDYKDFLKSIQKPTIFKSPESLLKALYLRHYMHNITLSRDEDIWQKLIEKSSDYYFYKPSNSTLLLSKHKNSKEYFVTTAFGFISGWRQPEHDLRIPEDKKFRQILHNLWDDEYVPLSEFKNLNDSMRFFHSVCEKECSFPAKNPIELGYGCTCQKGITEKKARKYVEKDNLFQLLDYQESNPRPLLKIKSLECGHEFSCYWDQWRRIQKCRVCMQKYRRTEILDKGRPTHYGIGIDPAERFKNDIMQLVGEEYTLVSPYKDLITNVNIRHNKCGKILTMKPDEFLRGRRCDCVVFPYGKDMIRYIEERSCGLYSCVEQHGTTYTLMDTYSMTYITLKKAMILQEFERPTPSEILPLPTKGEFTRKKRNKEIIIDYITCHYLPGEEFRVCDLKIDHLNDSQIRQVLVSKHMKGVEVLGNGRYRYIGGMR